MTNGFKGLRVYNTLTRAKEDFVPIDADRVRMYVCGPTVYDYAHIGNARPAIVFDILFRLLRHLYGEDHVTYVRNITDVDDKINARARRDYPDLPLNEAIREVTQKTADQYHADVAALGCLRPTIEPRATEFVLPRADGLTDMASLIQTLMDRGHAYEANGEILFDTASMPAYGGLSKRKLEDQQAGARIAVEAHKKNPADFVLWKQSSADEPGWDAQFTIDGEAVTIRGRPGWHIECSAMSAAYLGEEFDIHGGGLDLIFPHHENEIAQSCCAHGRDVMARYWMHNGFLQVEGRKMSKSEGNFVTINQLLETEVFGGRSWPGEVLRLAMLMTHYREPIDFSVRKLEEAEAVLENWREFMFAQSLSWQEENRNLYENELKIPEGFLNVLSDDLNTPAAIVQIHKMAKSKNIETAHQVYAALQLLGVVNFDSMQKWEAYQEPAALSDYLNVGMVEKMIDERSTHLLQKNFAEADRIRDELTAQGVQLMDYKDPESGERRTKWEVKR